MSVSTRGFAHVAVAGKRGGQQGMLRFPQPELLNSHGPPHLVPSLRATPPPPPPPPVSTAEALQHNSARSPYGGGKVFFSGESLKNGRLRLETNNGDFEDNPYKITGISLRLLCS